MRHAIREPSERRLIPVPGPASRRFGDTVFRGATRAAGLLILAVLAGIAAFLAYRAVPGLRANTANFLTTTDWLPDGSPARFGIAALAFGTLLSSFLALIATVPVALGVGVFITDYAPRRVATLLGYLVDLLAAVPSVVYGLWGLYFLIPRITPVQIWLARYLAGSRCSPCAAIGPAWRRGPCSSPR